MWIHTFILIKAPTSVQQSFRVFRIDQLSILPDNVLQLLDLILWTHNRFSDNIIDLLKGPAINGVSKIGKIIEYEAY